VTTAISRTLSDGPQAVAGVSVHQQLLNRCPHFAFETVS
jgi:hypothetical protein